MRSQNGWSAAPDLKLRPLVIAGEAFSPGIRDDDDVATVLGYVAQQMHERVEPLVRDDWHQADDWGFSFRENRNDPNALSNHSSATALDYNATRHPNGVPTYRTFTAEQIREIHQILAEVDHTVRWGGDYSGTPDAMHFEINTDAATLRITADRLRGDDSDMAQHTDQLNRIEAAALAAVSAAEKTKQRVDKMGANLAKDRANDKALLRALREVGVDVDQVLKLAEKHDAES